MVPSLGRASTFLGGIATQRAHRVMMKGPGAVQGHESTFATWRRLCTSCSCTAVLLLAQGSSLAESHSNSRVHFCLSGPPKCNPRAEQRLQHGDRWMCWPLHALHTGGQGCAEVAVTLLPPVRDVDSGHLTATSPTAAHITVADASSCTQQGKHHRRPNRTVAVLPVVLAVRGHKATLSIPARVVTAACGLCSATACSFWAQSRCC